MQANNNNRKRNNRRNKNKKKSDVVQDQNAPSSSTGNVENVATAGDAVEVTDKPSDPTEVVTEVNLSKVTENPTSIPSVDHKEKFHLEEELKKSELRSEELEKKLTVLQTENMSVKQQIQIMEEEADRQKTDLKVKLQMTQAQLQDTDNKKQDLQNVVVNLNQTISDLQLKADKEKGDLQKNIDALLNEKKALEKNVNDGEKEIAALKNAISESRARKKSESTPNVAAKDAQLEVLETELKNLQKKMHANRTENQKLLKELKKKDQAEDLNNARLHLNNREKECIQLRSKIETLEKQNSRLQKRLSRRSQTCDRSCGQDEPADSEDDNDSDTQAKLNEYKTTLQSTESILSNLQSAVDTEQLKWAQALKDAELESAIAKEESKRLSNEVQLLKNKQVNHCVEKEVVKENGTLPDDENDLMEQIVQLEEQVKEIVSEKNNILASKKPKGAKKKKKAPLSNLSFVSEDALVKIHDEMERESKLKSQIKDQNQKIKQLLANLQDALQKDHVTLSGMKANQN